MKKGFYKSTRVDVDDYQGGVVFRIESYYYIGYINKNKLFLILGEGRDFPNWELFVRQYENLDVKGKITEENNGLLEISFYNLNLKVKEIFKGREENDKLYLKGFRQDDPENIWLEDVFEYIGTGE